MPKYSALYQQHFCRSVAYIMIMIILACYLATILLLRTKFKCDFRLILVRYQACFDGHTLKNLSLYYQHFCLQVAYTSKYDHFNLLFGGHFFGEETQLGFEEAFSMLSNMLSGHNAETFSLMLTTFLPSQLHIRPIMIV